MKEADLSKKVLQWMNKQPGCFAWKLHVDQYNQVGLPDIHACYLGHYVAIELKRSAEHKPTPMQLHRMGELNKAGAITAIVYTLEQVQELISRIYAAERGANGN